MFFIKLSSLLIIICSLSLIGLKIYNHIEYKEHLKKINNLVYDNVSTKYIGYVEVERLGVKRGIVNGINDDILNANDVGLEIRDKKIVLAGHSIENVFGKLHKIKMNDIVYLYLNNKKESYTVTSIKVVNKTSVESLNNQLNLITCMYNPNERLVIGAKKNT